MSLEKAGSRKEADGNGHTQKLDSREFSNLSNHHTGGYDTRPERSEAGFQEHEKAIFSYTKYDNREFVQRSNQEFGRGGDWGFCLTSDNTSAKEIGVSQPPRPEYNGRYRRPGQEIKPCVFGRPKYCEPPAANSRGYGYNSTDLGRGYPWDERSHGYPRDERSHGYPWDERSHGYPRDERSHGYPRDEQSHGYPRDERSHRYPQGEPAYYPQDNERYYPQPTLEDDSHCRDNEDKRVSYDHNTETAAYSRTMAIQRKSVRENKNRYAMRTGKLPRYNSKMDDAHLSGSRRDYNSKGRNGPNDEEQRKGIDSGKPKDQYSEFEGPRGRSFGPRSQTSSPVSLECQSKNRTDDKPVPVEGRITPTPVYAITEALFQTNYGIDQYRDDVKRIMKGDYSRIGLGIEDSFEELPSTGETPTKHTLVQQNPSLSNPVLEIQNEILANKKKSGKTRPNRIEIKIAKKMGKSYDKIDFSAKLVKDTSSKVDCEPDSNTRFRIKIRNFPKPRDNIFRANNPKIVEMYAHALFQSVNDSIVEARSSSIFTLNNTQIYEVRDKPIKAPEKVSTPAGNSGTSVEFGKPVIKASARGASHHRKVLVMNTFDFYDDLQIKASPIHGLGVFAPVAIPENTLVMEYQGEIIGKCVSDKREVLYKKNNIQSVYMFTILEDIIIDATLTGNKARYVNHSCNPNCEAILSEADRSIKYCTIRRIEASEELTINYHIDPADNTHMNICNCQDPSCEFRANTK